MRAERTGTVMACSMDEMTRRLARESLKITQCISFRVELRSGALLDPKVFLTCQTVRVLNCVEHEPKRTLKRWRKDQSQDVKSRAKNKSPSQAL